MDDLTPNPSNLMPGLYQGSRPPVGDTLRRMRFDAVVLCAREYQPRRRDFPGVEVLRIHLDDQPKYPSVAMMRAAAAIADRCAYMVQAGRLVLVTCNAGINRSGLVSALTIMRLLGCDGAEAVRTVQAGRPGALSNPYFADALMRLPAGWLGHGGAAPRWTPQPGGFGDDYPQYSWVPGSPEIDTAPWLRWQPCLLYTSPSPRDGLLSRMPSSA